MQMRVEKGTANFNTARTLIFGMIAALAILLGTDPLIKKYDELLRPKPWLYANIEVLPRREGGLPLISYQVNARLDLRGRWKAYVMTTDAPRRICGGQGDGQYDPSRHSAKAWSWQAFFETNTCGMPDETFQVCVQYDVQANSGARGQFGPFCSDPYNWRGSR